MQAGNTLVKKERFNTVWGAVIVLSVIALLAFVFYLYRGTPSFSQELIDRVTWLLAGGFAGGGIVSLKCYQRNNKTDKKENP